MLSELLYTAVIYTHAVQEQCGSADTLRLTQLSSEEFGRLEVCVGGIWGTVCGNGATNAVADVTCRELNHAALGLET